MSISTANLVIQDPREGVRTKFSKKIVTYFLPVGDDLKQVVIEWLRNFAGSALRERRSRFSSHQSWPGRNLCFAVGGLEPDFWASAEPIRKIFRQAFAAAGLDYFNPHSFRDTLVQFGKRLCRTPEEFRGMEQEPRP